MTALAAVQGRVARRLLTAPEDLDVKLAEGRGPAPAW